MLHPWKKKDVKLLMSVIVETEKKTQSDLDLDPIEKSRFYVVRFIIDASS